MLPNDVYVEVPAIAAGAFYPDGITNCRVSVSCGPMSDKVISNYGGHN